MSATTIYFPKTVNRSLKHFQLFQVPVTVYYESLCPDSKAFITEQLTPALRSPLGMYVELQLVPYGKSTVCDP